MPQDPRQRDGCRFTAQNITAAQEKNPFAKISDIVYELLEKAIFSSAIPPGSRLNISKLAEQMGGQHLPGDPSGGAAGGKRPGDRRPQQRQQIPQLLCL